MLPRSSRVLRVLWAGCWCQIRFQVLGYPQLMELTGGNTMVVYSHGDENGRKKNAPDLR
jgi:hypothetical protein